MDELTFYGRDGCTLCDEMLAELAPWAAARGLKVRVRDVDDDPLTQRRYGLKVPVVEVDGLCVCAGHLDVPELERLFRPVPGGR